MADEPFEDEPPPSTTYTISPARLAANRANAARSTGPRTARGKARARLNGLVHGMRAEIDVIPGEDPDELRRRLDAWTEELGAETEAERYLVRNAVRASWRIDRCQAAETAALTERIQELAETFDDERAHDVAYLAADFEDKPPDSVHRLRRTSHGCRWLIEQWEALARHLEDHYAVEPADRLRGVSLMGYWWNDLFQAPEVERWVVAHVAGGLSGHQLEERWLAGHLIAHSPEGMETSEFVRRIGEMMAALPPRDVARATAREMVAGAIAELSEREAWLRDREERDLVLRMRQASFDASASGASRLRYEMAHERALRSSLRELRALRSSRPEASPAPTEARVPDPPASTDRAACDAPPAAPSEIELAPPGAPVVGETPPGPPFARGGDEGGPSAILPPPLAKGGPGGVIGAPPQTRLPSEPHPGEAEPVAPTEAKVPDPPASAGRMACDAPAAATGPRLVAPTEAKVPDRAASADGAVHEVPAVRDADPALPPDLLRRPGPRSLAPTEARPMDGVSTIAAGGGRGWGP